MKITRMDVYTVDAGWRNWIFVVLSTDNGYVGVGEATTVYNESMTLAALEDLRGLVIGIDPRNIEAFWARMPYGRPKNKTRSLHEQVAQ